MAEEVDPEDVESTDGAFEFLTEPIYRLSAESCAPSVKAARYAGKSAR